MLSPTCWPSEQADGLGVGLDGALALVLRAERSAEAGAQGGKGHPGAPQVTIRRVIRVLERCATVENT